MPVLPNYLAVGRGSECVAPDVLEAFRQHFHEAINVGGTELGFMARWNSFRERLLNAAWVSAGESEDDHLRQESLNSMSAQLDSLYNLILGMGQLAFAWQLIPTPAETAPEDAPEIVSVPSSSKAKAKEARRFTHVLSNIIAKNFRVEGPHGVPAEARRNVPDEDGMIAEMVAAMADRSEILDFADTKPFKDHWQNMGDSDFRRLAKTLIYHINELHQGIDYIEGFCYTDRYRNLITLLKGCKGTIYFMSRPSTYEDVILNPHMMRLRFADNQKNNSKKKADNKELTLRRHSEYISLHGCPPPPKARTGKGKKRNSSVMDDNEDASPSPSKPAPKRQRAALRSGKAAPRIVFDAGESSSAQQTIDTPPMDTSAFLDVPDLDEAEFRRLQEKFLDIPAADLTQQGDSPPQPYYPLPEQNQQYYNPAQHQQAYPLQQQQQSTPKKSGSSKKQRKHVPKEIHTQSMALSSNAGPISPFPSPSNEIENQIVTTLASSFRKSVYPRNQGSMFDSESSNEPHSVDRQMYQQAGFYQPQNALYPDINVTPNKVVPVHDQIAQIQYLEQSSPASHVPQFHRTQQHLRHNSHGQQYMSMGILDDSVFSSEGTPFWGSEAAAAAAAAAVSGFSSFTDRTLTGLGGEADAGHQNTVDPRIFDQQMQGNQTMGTNYYDGIDMSAPGFGDLNLDDLEPSIDSGYLTYLPTTNTGGQGVQCTLGGRNKMKEMEDLLAADP